jgi:hypothetical protein
MKPSIKDSREGHPSGQQPLENRLLSNQNRKNSPAPTIRYKPASEKMLLA